MRGEEGTGRPTPPPPILPPFEEDDPQPAAEDPPHHQWRQDRGAAGEQGGFEPRVVYRKRKRAR